MWILSFLCQIQFYWISHWDIRETQWLEGMVILSITIQKWHLLKPPTAGQEGFASGHRSKWGLELSLETITLWCCCCSCCWQVERRWLPNHREAETALPYAVPGKILNCPIPHKPFSLDRCLILPVGMWPCRSYTAQGVQAEFLQWDFKFCVIPGSLDLLQCLL